MLKTKLKFLLLGSLLVTCVAQAVKETMSWYVKPNVAIINTISAISPSLSAACVSNIHAGQLVLIINGQKRLITPAKNTITFSQINGKPLPTGKFSYSYYILLKVPNNTSGIISVSCSGDNHLAR